MSGSGYVPSDNTCKNCIVHLPSLDMSLLSFFQTSKASKVHFSGLFPLMVLDLDATLQKQEIPHKSATVFSDFGQQVSFMGFFANLKWKYGPMQIWLRLRVTVEVKVMKWKKKNCDITYYLYSLLTMHKITVRVLWQIINWTGQKRM